MNPHPELVDGVNVDAVASAVRACPGVDDLAAGPMGSGVVSYLPGRKLAGVSVSDDHVTIQVRAQWGTVLPELARDLRSRVAGLVGGRRVEVSVAELADPPGWKHDQPASSSTDTAQRADEVGPWTSTSSDKLAGSSSRPTTQTTAATPLPSSQD